MHTPPPLPAHPAKPVRRAVFKEIKSIRFGDVSFDYQLIESAHAKAEAWINQNPGIEIIQIETFHSSLHGITVVWFR